MSKARRRPSRNPAKRVEEPTPVEPETSEPESRFARIKDASFGWSLSLLAGASVFLLVRLAAIYSPDPVSLFLVVASPSILTLWALPPARRKHLLRWPVSWALIYTSTITPILIVAVTAWIVHRFFFVDFPGQHRWAADTAPTAQEKS